MSLPAVVVWTAKDTLRLRYVLDWLLGERLGLTYSVTLNATEARNARYSIFYGMAGQPVSVFSATLLGERGVGSQDIASQEWNGLFTLFFDSGSRYDIPFDLFAAIFYLLTRYEEYQSFLPDRHGRYPAENSVLFGNGVLERPVVDEWVEMLRQILEQRWGVEIPPRSFSYKPTYDIDIAWSYRHKGLKRATGGVFRDLVQGRLSCIEDRIRVYMGKTRDPYDAFQFMEGLHQQYNMRPVWFFLAALQPSGFDKNIHPCHPAMKQLIRHIAGDADVGIHPSYYSDSKPGRLAAEKRALESVAGKSTGISRQHFIRLRFPDTYHSLIREGIKDDYSMGYSTRLGFRAGTGASFLWYDLSSEAVTNLRVHPFAFMDTTAHFDLGLSADEAFERLRAMAARLRQLHGELITIFHNFSLGTEQEWNGWATAYGRFLNDMAGETQSL